MRMFKLKMLANIQLLQYRLGRLNFLKRPQQSFQNVCHGRLLPLFRCDVFMIGIILHQKQWKCTLVSRFGCVGDPSITVQPNATEAATPVAVSAEATFVVKDSQRVCRRRPFLLNLSWFLSAIAWTAGLTKPTSMCIRTRCSFQVFTVDYNLLWGLTCRQPWLGNNFACGHGAKCKLATEHTLLGESTVLLQADIYEPAQALWANKVCILANVA